MGNSLRGHLTGSRAGYCFFALTPHQSQYS